MDCVFSRVIIAAASGQPERRIIPRFQSREVIVRSIVSLSLLLVMLALPLRLFGRTPAPSQQVHDPYAIPEDPVRRAAMEKEMAKKANQERQAQLRRDTERLFRLSSELKQYVDKSSENTLSLEVIKKAEEIEKLAHSVKEKMKGN
jgi:hypothetical protein